MLALTCIREPSLHLSRLLSVITKLQLNGTRLVFDCVWVGLGWMYRRLFLTRTGRIYSCGLGRFGQLGHGDEVCLMTPKPIAGAFCAQHRADKTRATHNSRIARTAFETTRIRMICAGGSHSFAVSEHDEQLYAWGRNEHGELGREDKVNQSLPTPLKVGQGDEPIISITSAHLLYFPIMCAFNRQLLACVMCVRWCVRCVPVKQRGRGTRWSSRKKGAATRLARGEPAWAARTRPGSPRSCPVWRTRR